MGTRRFQVDKWTDRVPIDRVGAPTQEKGSPEYRRNLGSHKTPKSAVAAMSRHFYHV